MWDILILDDDPLDADNLRLCLEDVVPSGKVHHIEAYRHLSGALLSLRSPIVFTDIVLDEDEGDLAKDGLDAISWIQQHYPNVPYVIVTGHYVEKVKEIVGQHLHDPQIAGILDKADYTSSDILAALAKAEEYVASSNRPSGRQTQLFHDNDKPPRSLDELVRKVLYHPGGGVEGLIRIAGHQETDWLEFKAATEPMPGDKKAQGLRKDDFRWHVARGLISLANTRGGALLLGVKDDASALGLSVSDPAGFLGKGGFDEFVRKVLSHCFAPSAGKWKTQKGQWRLDGNLGTYVVCQKHELDGEQVAALIVKPVPVGGTLIRVAEPSKQSERLLIRTAGETGQVKELWGAREQLEFERSRKIPDHEPSQLWKKFLKGI